MSSDAEARLNAFFAEQAPPARDPLFKVAVMARIARRRFLLTWAAVAPLWVAAGGVMWAAGPVLAELLATPLMSLGSAGMAGLTLASLYLLRDKIFRPL